MPILGRVPESPSPEISSEAAYGDVIEVVANGRGFSLLHERFRSSAPEGWKRLRAVPSHRLIFAAGPIGDPADDLQHFLHAVLRLRRGDALDALEGLGLHANRGR